MMRHGMACILWHFVSYFLSCFVSYLVLYSVRWCSLQAEQSDGQDAESKNAAPVLSGLVLCLKFHLVFGLGRRGIIYLAEMPPKVGLLPL